MPHNQARAVLLSERLVSDHFFGWGGWWVELLGFVSVDEGREVHCFLLLHCVFVVCPDPPIAGWLTRTRRTGNTIFDTPNKFLEEFLREPLVD